MQTVHSFNDDLKCLCMDDYSAVKFIFIDMRVAKTSSDMSVRIAQAFHGLHLNTHKKGKYYSLSEIAGSLWSCCSMIIFDFHHIRNTLLKVCLLITNDNLFIIPIVEFRKRSMSHGYDHTR